MKFIKVNNFDLKKEGEKKIWRYTSLKRLKDFLESSQLYFSSAKNLLPYDSFEGSLSDLSIQGIEDLDIPQESLQDVKTFLRNQPTSKAFEKLLNLNHINCWHMSDFESFLMWKVYGGDEKPIAIQTTVSKLIKSLIPYKIKETSNPENLYFGAVNYIDFQKTDMDTGMEKRFFTKRIEFSQEAEFRLLISLRMANECGIVGPLEGIFVKFKNLDFIENIYLSPCSDEKQEKETKKYLSNCKFDKYLKKSTLNALHPKIY